jgi:dTDP-4-dehydro-6-deoxy-alpha-D-glucopyranose 2,3-dehydratase
MNKIAFLKSALSFQGVCPSISEAVEWVKRQNDLVNVSVEKTTFNKLKSWSYDERMGNIVHSSGKFFSIDGINIKINLGSKPTWDQPIINQPEIGYLGFIVKEIDGVLHFLMQGKIEPGNVNHVQLSPTLQATRSNYSQIHKGKKPLYLEYFQNAEPHQILLDQLQSEQGARFLRKRNRNIIVKVDEEIPIFDNFLWLTLGQIKKLMQIDNLVNMDTRTVISGIPFGDFSEDIVDLFYFFGSERELGNFQKDFLKSALVKEGGLHSIEEIITFLTKLKSIYDLEVVNIDLKKMKDWVFTDRAIHHIEHKYFSVIPVEVEIGNREVVSWNQPMVEPAYEGLCAFVCKKINGVLHFVVQAKLECGNHDIIEFAPTVQCMTGNYRQTGKGVLPFLDYVLNVKKDQIYFDSIQSEEGGRFYKEQNRNLIVIAGDEVDEMLPERYIWMTLNQLYTFLKFNNYLNIQARSLIAAISFA